MKNTDEYRILKVLNYEYVDNEEAMKSAISLLKAYKETAYPDTEADGYVYCGKCGKLK